MTPTCQAVSIAFAWAKSTSNKRLVVYAASLLSWVDVAVLIMPRVCTALSNCAYHTRQAWLRTCKRVAHAHLFLGGLWNKWMVGCQESWCFVSLKVRYSMWLVASCNINVTGGCAWKYGTCANAMWWSVESYHCSVKRMYMYCSCRCHAWSWNWASVRELCLFLWSYTLVEVWFYGNVNSEVFQHFVDMNVWRCIKWWQSHIMWSWQIPNVYLNVCFTSAVVAHQLGCMPCAWWFGWLVGLMIRMKDRRNLLGMPVELLYCRFESLQGACVQRCAQHYSWSCVWCPPCSNSMHMCSMRDHIQVWTRTQEIVEQHQFVYLQFLCLVCHLLLTSTLSLLHLYMQACMKQRSQIVRLYGYTYSFIRTAKHSQLACTPGTSLLSVNDHQWERGLIFEQWESCVCGCGSTT